MRPAPVAAWTFAVAATLCPAADLYRVAGAVVNAQTGAPVPHAEVYIYKSGTAFPRAPFVAGVDGRFTFDLPEGAYVLRAGTRVRVENYGEQNQENGFGSAVIVGPGQDTGTLVFRWFPAAAIFGTVVDDSGEPVEGALVQLLRSHVAVGHRVTATFRWYRTNDRGEFRFGQLPGAGRYYLAVTGTPWYEAGARAMAGEEPAAHPAAFIPVYYPNTSDAARATPLLVAPGEETRADFTLTTAVGATVTVTHSGPADLKGSVSLTRDGIAGIDSFQEQQALTAVNGAAGKIPQLLTGVPPGHYVVSVTGTSGKSYLAGRTAIDVNGSDVGVEVPLRPAATIGGSVQFLNPAAKPAGTLRVALQVDGVGAVLNAAVRPDGSFLFPDVPHGEYRIGVVGVGFFVSHSEAAGVPFRDGLLTVTEGDAGTVSLTISNETGRLNGFVMNGDRPAAAVMVVLARAEESRNPVHYRGYQTESDGSFDYRNIPAGSYSLFAVEDTSFEYANPDAVRPYLADAKAVRIEPHGMSTERIPVTPARPQ